MQPAMDMYGQRVDCSSVAWPAWHAAQTCLHEPALMLEQESLLASVFLLGCTPLLGAHHVHLALHSACADDNHLAPVCCKVPLCQLRLQEASVISLAWVTWMIDISAATAASRSGGLLAAQLRVRGGTQTSSLSTANFSIPGALCESFNEPI